MMKYVASLRSACRSLALLIAVGLSGSAHARSFTFDDLLALARVSAPAVSPDGRTFVWQQDRYADTDGRMHAALWTLDLGRPDSVPVRLTDESEGDAQAPVFGPDGKTIYFLSDRSGEEAIWSVPLAGGRVKRQTSFKGGLRGFEISPRGDKLLVWADRPIGAKTLAPPSASAVRNASDARVYDHLFIRHWNKWADGTRSQLFILNLSADGALGDGSAIVSGPIGDTPSSPDGSEKEISWSQDGASVYFALREAGEGSAEVLSTNLDIFAVPADGSAQPVNLTAANLATDNWPSVSPDGRWLAWAAMEKPGYESDHMVVWLRDLRTGQIRPLSQSWDRSVKGFKWSLDSRAILAVARDHYDLPLFSIDLRGRVTRLTEAGTVADFVPTRHGIVVQLNTLTAPNDFFMLTPGGKLRQLTNVNAAILGDIDMPTPERFSFTGAAGDTVWGYVVKPHGTPPGAKLPLGFMVHGGPQSSVGNAWSYRWNQMLFASSGFAMVFVDFHGSEGYGQTFTDSIRNDDAGKSLEDLQLGLDAALQRYPWLDGDRACAMGGSFGGFMMNWIAGHWPDQFKCIVQHDGIFDARAMAYETDELWYDRWQHGGQFYHEKPEAFERWNPVNAVAQWRTPMLVITGEKDFRIPYTQGIAAFTALQARGVPSRLIVFPQGGHLVTRPADSRKWYEEVTGWIRTWTRKPGS